MPLCPRSSSDSVANHRDSNGWWHFMCPVCCISLAFGSKDYTEAKRLFWVKHDFQTKDKTMAQPKYEDGYKQGVGDALSILDEEASLPRSTTAYIRKKLLTKKVTKWGNVYHSRTFDPVSIKYGQAVLFDTEQEAKSEIASAANYVGTYPIEIEVPL